MNKPTERDLLISTQTDSSPFSMPTPIFPADSFPVPTSKTSSSKRNASSSCRGSLCRGILLFILISLLGTSLQGQENAPWVKMLDGFRERKYFDTALDYLDSMQTSPLCGLGLKKQIDYQKAMVHLDAVEEGLMFLPRDEHMKACRELLDKYLKANPDGEYAFEAQSTLGRLHMEEGRINMLKSEHELTKDAEREPLRKKAREEFQKALPFFQAADKMATEKAKKIQEIQKVNASAVKEADQLAAYGRYLAGKISILLVRSDIAKTYPNNSKEFKDGLTAVAKEFADLGSKYNSFSAGFDAKLYAANAYRDLGDFKTARGILGELNTLQGEDFLKIRTESLLLALDMNLAEKKPENYLDSINRARSWNESVPASAKRSRDGQRVFLLGAKNFIAYAEMVKANKTDSDKAIRDAGVFLRQINSDNPAFMKEAKELLKQIGAVKVNKGEPETYEQAKEFADEDWKDFTLAFSDLQDAKTDADKAKAKAKLMEIGNTCLVSMNRAIRMREEGTPIDEINGIRQNLVRVYWFQGKLLEAAILADYLAQHYSGSPNADKNAEMAVRLLRQVFIEEKLDGQDTNAIANKLSRLCDFIMSRWEGNPVTGEVQLIQIETAIDNGNIDDAKKLLAKTQEGTAQRVSAELKIGQSLWNRYATVSRIPEGSGEKPDKKAIDALIADAKKQLESGLKAKLALIKEDKGKPDNAAVQCAMALGQICLNINDSKGAIDWLTNPSIGPIPLAANPPSGVDSAMLKNLQLPAMMSVLRAYVASENLDKAEETMNDLEKTIKEQGSDDQKLTQIYISLGRQLENRLKELNEAGEVDQAEKVAKGFELFLKRIKDRGESNSFQSLYWVADTFYRLGSGMSTEKSVPPQAAAYYKLAGGTYVDILKRVAEEDNWAPDKAEETIKVRLAESLRCIGEYEKAIKFLDVLLQESENRIDIQIEAAKTLEAWGRKDPEKYIRAAAGRFPNKHVWGWNGLIKRTSTNIQDPKFAEVYYDAYLNKFRCALEAAKTEKDKAKKDKLIENTNRDFTTLIQTRPQLGGAESFAQFDLVYRNLERAMGSAKPAGIKELQKSLGETPHQEEPKKTAKAVPDLKDEDLASLPSDVGKGGAAKKETKAPVKQDDTGPVVLLGIGLVVLITPVAAFFAFRKKKK